MKKIFSRNFQDAGAVPLGNDASNRFLPWITGLMVYLAVIALTVTMVVSHTGKAWRNDLAGTLTVQILPDVDDKVRSLDARTKAASELLLATPGVANARILPNDQLTALLEPWLGTEVMTTELPVPRLIDVTLDDNAGIDTKELSTRLTALIPGASLDNHAIWLDRLLDLIGAIETVTMVVLALIGTAGVSIVIFTTRSGLAIHQDVIMVLHIIGARDTYIARQFQMHVLKLALKGGLVGFTFGAITIIMFNAMTDMKDHSLIFAFSLTFEQWILLSTLHLIAAMIGTATARLTVIQAISRIT